MRISNLRYTGLEAVIRPSDNLSLLGPRIGYARLLNARNVPNYSTIADILSVITLGHTLRLPLMCPSSELVDGSEPHGQKRSAGCSVSTSRVVGRGGGVPGVGCGWVGAGGGVLPTQPPSQPEADLRLIYRIL